MDTPSAWTPGTLLETSGYYWKTATLHAGVSLDVFSIIGDGELTAVEVAEAIGAVADPTERLLNGLAGMELLVKSDGRYRNTDASRAYLCRDAEGYIGYMIRHHHHLVESWARLDESVRTGRPVRPRASFEDEERRESFLMGMFNLAMSLAPKVVAAVDLSDRTRLLDLGGGPGTYSIHFCRENPDLRATVFDLPTTRPFAERTIARFGLSDRIDFVGGSYLEDPVPGGFDAAWLSHVLHGESPAGAEMIIRKAAEALMPGGVILVHDFILDDGGDRPAFPALFSLNMLLGTDGGRAYTDAEIRKMLEAAGAGEIHRLDFRGTNDSGIIAGRV
jgi:SAM-dependent methyltransferase